MASRAAPDPVLADAVEAAVAELVRVTHWGDASFINLPLLFPSGTPVSVRVSMTEGGVRVDDGGFAYREIEHVGAERSFANAADRTISAEGLDRNRRVIFVEVPFDGLITAICDVGMASREVAERVFKKVIEQEESEIEEQLRPRLERIFGKPRLDEAQSIMGSSTSEWNVSAIVHTDGTTTVFQAVSNHPNSIYKASTVFHDLMGLVNPPHRVAVVRDRGALGPKLGVLAQAGRVIQGDQGDDVYERAAA